MTNNNPWFWGGKTRAQFVQELEKNAVLLVDGKKLTQVKKVDIEAVRARKNALVKNGVLRNIKPSASSSNVTVIKAGVVGAPNAK